VKEANRQRQIATGQAAGVQALWLSENGHSEILAERAAALARESWQLFGQRHDDRGGILTDRFNPGPNGAHLAGGVIRVKHGS
jgi:hypothetical protein